jgi:hypothetical protein
LSYFLICTDSIKPNLQFSCNFVVINASEGSLCFHIFILHNSRCQVLCGSCKSCLVLHLSVVIFFGPSGTLMPALLSVENLVPLKPVLGGVRDVALIHYPSCTDSIKPSLQFSCNLLWLMLPRDHFVSRFLYSVVNVSLIANVLTE